MGLVFIVLVAILSLLHLLLLSSAFIGVRYIEWPLIFIAVLGVAVLFYYQTIERKRQGALVGAVAGFNSLVIFIMLSFFDQMSMRSSWIVFYWITWMLVVVFVAQSVFFITKTVKSGSA